MLYSPTSNHSHYSNFCPVGIPESISPRDYSFRHYELASPTSPTHGVLDTSKSSNNQYSDNYSSDIQQIDYEHKGEVYPTQSQTNKRDEDENRLLDSSTLDTPQMCVQTQPKREGTYHDDIKTGTTPKSPISTTEHENANNDQKLQSSHFPFIRVSQQAIT
jgi:hypothetical protein